MEPRPQLEKWQAQVAMAGEDAVADMGVAKRLLNHGIEALSKIAALEAEKASTLARIAELERENAELRRDAERLDWVMRKVRGCEFRRIGVTYGGNCGRDSIDAAMKKENGNG